MTGTRAAAPIEAEWRVARGWSARELKVRLENTKKLSRNTDTRPEDMTLARGWGEHYSEALVAREAKGDIELGGDFELLKKAVTQYSFSDPRIVTGYFDDDAPLLGRTMLLELKPLTLRYLCGVRIGAVREETDARRTVFGFRYDTLEGHVETGSEWFLLTKNHDTGEIRFRIHAWWKLGTFPNWWSRLGFHLVGRRYQRAWHRLAYVRLREISAEHDLPALPRAEHILQSGPEIPNPGVVIMGARHSDVPAKEHECVPR